MKIRFIAKGAVIAAVALLATQEALAIVGSDNSADGAYVSGWGTGTNGGVGFEPWNLVSEATSNGFAGFFVQSDSAVDNGIDNVGQADGDLGSAWTSFANKGDGIDAASAYRELTEPLDGAGDTFSVSFENGFVNGLAGVALRTGNQTATASDFASGARAQLYFAGGSGGYTIEDAAGAIPLDGLTAGLPQVPFTFFGANVSYTLTSANTYDIEITKYNSAAGSGGDAPDVFNKTTHAGLGGRTLAGSGAIDSVALFQQDVETQSDAFYNRLSYSAAGGNGADDASDSEYADFGWQAFAGGGSGFGLWEFATETDGGFAGTYVQSGVEAGVDNTGTTGGSPVAPDGAVWASYANKGNFADKSTQYRDLNNTLSQAGDSFSVSFENGFVDPSGKIGLSLRDRSVDSFNETADGFADEALFQFFFEGGDETYTLVDATGEVDTGVGFSFFGIELDLTFTSATTYDLDITRFNKPNDPAPQVTTLTGLTFAGTAGDGTIESLAFFNIDASTQSDVFFNNLAYSTVDNVALLGDYNADGIVNAADYTVWRDNLEKSDTALNGNGSSDPSGLVVQGDYTLWVNNFGAASIIAISVPEPSGWLLCLLGMLASARFNRYSAAPCHAGGQR